MTNTVMSVLPNGVLMPQSFQPEQIDENARKELHCRSLKEELALELNRSTFTEIKKLFQERGGDFLAEMFFADPWLNVSHKGISILEKVLQGHDFALPEETLRYLLTFYVDHSEQAKTLNMNLLHVLARNCGYPRAAALFQTLVMEKPHLLKERLTLQDGLDLTPVEMAIKTSYNENIINLALSKYQESVGVITASDKEKLLMHAQWLSGSGIYHTSIMGQRLMMRIKDLPVI